MFYYIEFLSQALYSGLHGACGADVQNHDMVLIMVYQVA